MLQCCLFAISTLGWMQGDGETIVSGRILYRVQGAPAPDLEVGTRPSAHVRVELRTGAQVLQTLAESDGSFRIVAPLSAAPRSLRILAESGVATLWAYGQRNQKISTSFTLGVLPSGGISLGDLLIAQSAEGAPEQSTWNGVPNSLRRVSSPEAIAHFVLRRISWGFQYASSRTEEVLPPVNVYLGAPTSNAWGARINLAMPAVSRYRQFVILHEYGHCIQSFLSTLAGGEPHSVFQRHTRVVSSFQEGWATYFAGAVLSTIYPSETPESIDLWGVSTERFGPSGGFSRLEAFQHSAGDGAWYESVVTALLWDLHDSVIEGEPFDLESNPDALFRTLDRLEQRADLTTFGEAYDGDRQALANLYSYYGIWTDDPHEMISNPPLDFWNDVRERSVRVNVGSSFALDVTRSAILQRRQSDWYRIDLPAFVRLSSVTLIARTENLAYDAAWGGWESPQVRLWKGNEVLASGPFLGIRYLRPPSIPTGESPLYIEFQNSSGYWGPYVWRLIASAALDPLEAPALMVEVPGLFHAPGTLEYVAPAGAFSVQVDPGYLSLTVEVERASAPIDGTGTISRSNGIFRQPFQEELGQERFFRARLLDSASGATSAWSPWVVVRTFPPPPAYYPELVPLTRSDVETWTDGMSGYAEPELLESLASAAPFLDVPGSYLLVWSRTNMVRSPIGVESHQFDVEVSIGGGSEFHPLASGLRSQFLILRPLPADSYQFRIRATNQSGSSGYASVTGSSTFVGETQIDAIAQVPGRTEVEISLSLAVQRELLQAWSPRDEEPHLASPGIQSALDSRKNALADSLAYEIYRMDSVDGAPGEAVLVARAGQRRWTVPVNLPGLYWFKARAIRFGEAHPFGPFVSIVVLPGE